MMEVVNILGVEVVRMQCDVCGRVGVCADADDAAQDGWVFGLASHTCPGCAEEGPLVGIPQQDSRETS
jgi:hypothetical protein